MAAKKIKAAAISETARRVLGLEEEREISGTTTTAGDALVLARAALHAWVDTAVAVVAVPGSGRVTLIHADGRSSTIASSDLAYRVSPKVSFAGE